jgi:hypothetical protein
MLFELEMEFVKTTKKHFMIMYPPKNAYVFFFKSGGVGEVEEQCRLFYSNSSNHLGTRLFRRNDLCLDVRNPRGLHVDQVADRACLPRVK